MKLHRVFALALVSMLVTHEAMSQTFLVANGSAVWNDNNNWTPATFPNSSGAAAILPASASGLTVDLGQPITVGSLTINKSSTGNITTTVTGSATNTLTFDGGTSTLTNGVSTTATGPTVIAAPIVFGPSMASSTFTASQLGGTPLQFTQSLSGTGNLSITRDVNVNASGSVILGAANSYNGNTSLTGSTTTDYLLVRLDNANSIPDSSPLTLTNSVILGLAAGNFTREVVQTTPTAGQFQIVAGADHNVGWAAFGQDRAVNLFGDGRAINWGTSGLNLDSGNNMALGHSTADKTLDFQNPLVLTGGTSITDRHIRIIDGSAAIDAKISGSITTGPTSKSNLYFLGDGTVTLTNANTYVSDNTTIQGPVVRLENAAALPTDTNLIIKSGGVLGLGNGNPTFTRTLGTGIGQVQFTTGNGGFAAFGGNRTVNLGNAGATVSWGVPFVPTGQNFLLSDINSDGTLDFQNPIDFGNVQRIFVVRDGTAAIDAVLSGGVSESGGAGGLRKNDDGTLQLVTASNYTGQTIVAGGALRLDHAQALPTSSQLSLQGGGVIGLGIGNDTFTRTMGTGAGQVSTSGTGGGFAAYDGTKFVRLNNSLSFTPTWGTAPFGATQLILSDGGANGTVVFENPINLGVTATTSRVITVRNGSAIIDAKISGIISGPSAFGITKGNPGTLELSAANTYAGATTINSGVLLLTNASAIPGGILAGSTGGNITFTGTNANNIAVLGLGEGILGQGNFTRALGTGAGQVNLGTNAAFAAYFFDRVVNFGGASAQVTWGSGSFVTGVFRLGDVGADKTVDFQNPINLNGAARTVSAANGTATVMGVLSGVISGTGSASSLIKTGGGTLAVTGANTYDGATTINQGRLLVNNTTGSGTGNGAVSVTGTGSILGGTGIIKPSTASAVPGISVGNGSILSPGASIGTLTLDGANAAGVMLSLASGATMFDELNNTLLSDQVALINGAAGDIAFNNNVINFSDLSLGTLATGAAYTLFTADVANAYSGLTTDGNGNITAGLSIGTGLSAYTTSLLQLKQVGNNIVLNIGLTGDYNGDGKVDAADFVVWRTNPAGFGGDPAGYDAWRSHFGSPPGSGAGNGLTGNQGVPEPATLVLICLTVPILASRKFRCRSATL